jgi:ribosomal protein L11 methyltransferase
MIKPRSLVGVFNFSPMNSYQQVSITVSSEEQKDILVALLAEEGYEGFAEERFLLKAFIPSTDFDEPRLIEILNQYQLGYALEEIRQRNWNAEWEAGFQPVLVDDFCSIRADFHPIQDHTVFDIIITPKMSFGTGHHATTYLMVESMRNISFEGKKVLDFGTGTGILAILADKMGATEIHAIDNDHWSIENAGENFTRNGSIGIRLSQADRIQEEEKFDVILANINKHVIISQLPQICKHLSAGGILLISGLLVSDSDDLAEAIQQYPLTLTERREKESWLCWLLNMKEND